MSRRLRAGVALATLAAALIALPAVPASAATEVPVDQQHPVAGGCATGAITAFEGSVTADGDARVTVAGWMLPCPGVELTAQFEIVFYGNVFGSTTKDRFHVFASATDPTPFKAGAEAESYQGKVVEQLPLAICAVDPNGIRVDCVRVVDQGAGQAPVVSRISVNDQVVRKVVFADTEGGPGGPGCGNCV